MYRRYHRREIGLPGPGKPAVSRRFWEPSWGTGPPGSGGELVAPSSPPLHALFGASDGRRAEGAPVAKDHRLERKILHPHIHESLVAGGHLLLAHDPVDGAEDAVLPDHLPGTTRVDPP